MTQRTARSRNGAIGLLAVLLLAGPAALPATGEEPVAPATATPTDSAPAPAGDVVVDPAGTEGPAGTAPTATLGPAPSEGVVPEASAHPDRPGQAASVDAPEAAAVRVLDVDRSTFTERDRDEGFVFTGSGFTPGADVVFWVPAGGDDGADVYEAVAVGEDGSVEFRFVPGRAGDEGSATGPDTYRVWVEERLAPERYESVGWYTLTLVTPVVEVDRTTFTDGDREEGFLLTGSGFVPGATVLVDVAYTGIDSSTMHHEVTVDDAGTFTFRFVPGGPDPERPEAQPSQYILFVRQAVDGRAEPVDWIYLDRVGPVGSTPTGPGGPSGDQGIELSAAPDSTAAPVPGGAPSARPVGAEARTVLAATGVDARAGGIAAALVGVGAALLVLRRHAARRRTGLA